MIEQTDHATVGNLELNRRLEEAAALVRRGAFDHAEQLLAGLLAMHPGNADAHRTMALLASGTARLGPALQHMAEACRLAPDRAEFHFQLACLQAHAGQLEQALGHFRVATERMPDFADGWMFQGKTLARLGRAADALASLRQAHHLAPDNGKVFDALAEAEFHGGWPADALPLWRTLLEQHPDDVHARLRTGETLSRLGFQDEAVALYREGVRRQPASDSLWLALAQAEEDNGERDAARASYERALALRPAWPFALACLVGMLRGQAPDTLLQTAVGLLDSSTLSDADRALVGYAVGKAHDARGQHDKAMMRWHGANAARQRVAGPPETDALRQRVDRIIDAFSKGQFADTPASASNDERFVFIVGMPRSGTTLTEQILAGHPRAFGCGELPDMTMIARGLSADGNADLPDFRVLSTQGALRQAIDRYTSAAARHAPGDALRLVDKEPLNFLHLGLIALMLPGARVIWCRRDPRDIAVSIYGENFALTEHLATDLASIGAYINQQARLMRHWQAVLPLPILESNYERLVTDPEGQARRIVEFTGLSWDPACLEFHRNTHAVQSPSRWQVRQPVHTRSVGRWRHYEAALAPLLRVLDDPDPDPAS